MLPKSPSETFFFPETQFGGFSDADGSLLFYARVNVLAQPAFRAVDFGCGRGAGQDDVIPWRRALRSLRGKVAKVTGLDVDPIGETNPNIDEFRLLDPSKTTWPLETESVEMIVCDNVIEHLPDPQAFFSEAARVLTPGGYVCIRTPNSLSYVGIISRMVPNRHHGTIVSQVQARRKEEDVFPTLYRCNTVAAIRRAFAKNGFRAVVYGYEAEPSYLHFSRVAYALGVLHRRLAPGFLRPAIFAFGQKLPK